MRRVLECGLQDMEYRNFHFHCSGHGSGIELATIVNKIGPKTIVPIHTEMPEIFPILFGDKVKTVKESLDL